MIHRYLSSQELTRAGSLGTLVRWLVPLTRGAYTHGLRTPNEGINQRYLKIWANVADKICFGRTEKFGSGSEFSAVQGRLCFLSGRP